MRGVVASLTLVVGAACGSSDSAPTTSHALSDAYSLQLAVSPDPADGAFGRTIELAVTLRGDAGPEGRVESVRARLQG